MASRIILLVEDEELAAELILDDLRKLKFENTLHATNLTEANLILEEEAVKLAILDIDLNQIENGLDLIPTLKKRKIPFIILSNIQDIKTLDKVANDDPVAYLPKPISLVSLRNSIRIAENKVVKIEKSKTIQLKGDDGLKKLVYFDQIAYVKSDNGGNDIYIWDKDTNQLNKYLDLHTLKSLENKLDNSIFWQVHRSYILNINFVDSYTYSDILLKYLDVKIPIGKTYRKEMTSKLSSL